MLRAISKDLGEWAALNPETAADWLREALEKADPTHPWVSMPIIEQTRRNAHQLEMLRITKG